MLFRVNYLLKYKIMMQEIIIFAQRVRKFKPQSGASDRRLNRTMKLLIENEDFPSFCFFFLASTKILAARRIDVLKNG